MTLVDCNKQLPHLLSRPHHSSSFSPLCLRTTESVIWQPQTKHLRGDGLWNISTNLECFIVLDPPSITTLSPSSSALSAATGTHKIFFLHPIPPVPSYHLLYISSPTSHNVDRRRRPRRLRNLLVPHQHRPIRQTLPLQPHFRQVMYPRMVHF